MKRALVTGGNGFLGRYIVLGLLQRGWKVYSFARSSQQSLADIGVSVIRGDLSDPTDVRSAIADKDAVFHVAARAGIWGSWEDYYQPNVMGTRNVISACRVHQVKQLIYTSTPSVVFNGQPFRGEDEGIPYGTNWLCHYARSKRIAEQEVLEANQDGGLKTIALRPHLIWGIGDPHIVPRIIAKARSGRLRIVGDGKNKVDITHVENAADAHLHALDALLSGHPGGQAYFISQGEPVVLWDWINELLRGVGLAPITRKVSFKKAYAIGSVLESYWKLTKREGEPPMTRFVATELAKDHYYSINAAHTQLGYIPKVSTEDGLEGLTRHILQNRDDYID